MARSLAACWMLASALVCVPTLAQTTPTTAPSATGVAAVPTNPSDPASSPVFVSAFTPLGDTAEAPAWIGTAVQEDLIVDLARVHLKPQGLQTGPSATPPPAGYLIRGSYQTLGQSPVETIRFEGELVDAHGNVLGGLSATGPMRDLFGLEDALSAQAVRRLHQLTAPAAINAPGGAMNPALTQVLQPPASAPPIANGYDGSVLQAYVNADAAPSNDYNDQVNASRTRQAYAADYSTGTYGGFGGFGGLGYGGLGYGGLGYGGLGLGGLGYGGFGFGGVYGDAGLGRGTFFGPGGNFGYGFGGGGGYAGGFHGGAFGAIGSGGGGTRGGFGR